MYDKPCRINERDPQLTLCNILGPGQNGWDFVDDILKHISLDENAWILIKI